MGDALLFPTAFLAALVADAAIVADGVADDADLAVDKSGPLLLNFNFSIPL